MAQVPKSLDVIGKRSKLGDLIQFLIGRLRSRQVGTYLSKLQVRLCTAGSSLDHGGEIFTTKVPSRSPRHVQYERQDTVICTSEASMKAGCIDILAYLLPLTWAISRSGRFHI